MIFGIVALESPTALLGLERLSPLKYLGLQAEKAQEIEIIEPAINCDIFVVTHRRRELMITPRRRRHLVALLGPQKRTYEDDNLMLGVHHMILSS